MIENLAPRLTHLSNGGGCSCKIGPEDLESLLSDAFGSQDRDEKLVVGGAGSNLLCGVESGDDGAVVQISAHTAVVTTTDFFPPVVDSPFDWGRIAAANALSDIYAMGGQPICALHLLAWPVDQLSLDIAAQVLRGGGTVLDEATCISAGGHSIQGDTPLYGLAVTGLASPTHLMRNDAAVPGDPITLTKPLGIGVLNNRHKLTGEVFPDAIATMAALNRDSARAAMAAGVRAATDVTGFGLLGHLYKMARASGVTAVLESAAVPCLSGTRESLADGYVPGGTRRNLEWVAPHLETVLPESELLLLADAQTSGGLVLAGEIAESPVIGSFVPRGVAAIVVH